MLKAELGYYLAPAGPLGEIPISIFGLRAIPADVAERLPKGFSRHHWQVEIYLIESDSYVWVNQSRHLVFLH